MSIDSLLFSSFSLHESIQEAVEEARYIRAREAQIADAKKKAADAEAHVQELLSEERNKMAAKNAAMNEVADLLAGSGDIVSEAGLANLVKWKLL